MADSPAQFVASTTVRDGRPAPEEWRHLGAPVPWLSVFAARDPDTEQDVAVFAPSSAATATQRADFERARSAWLVAADADGVAPVLAHGDSPRPWLAVEPWSLPGTVSPATARSILIDLAEGVWQVESAGWAPPPREWLQVDPEAGSGAVCWPLGSDGTGTSGVEGVGAVGYELLTGEAVPAGDPAWPGGGQPPLWRVVETALTAPAMYGNCYELKRALLFGPATPLSGEADEPDPAADRSDAATPETAGIGAQLSRRAAVGVLGLGALGLTGLFARGSDTDAGPEQPQDGVPAASFGFVQNRNTLEVIHDGGDTIEAGNLFIRNPPISGENVYRWSDFEDRNPPISGENIYRWSDSEDYDDQTSVSEGDSILVDRQVMSVWFVEVVWRSPDDDREVVLEKRRISEEEGFEWP